MPFALFDSIDGVVVNGYVDGLDNEFENEDFNPPAETAMLHLVHASMSNGGELPRQSVDGHRIRGRVGRSSRH